MSKTSQQEMTGRPENTKGVSRRGFMIGATSAGFTLAFVPSALLTAAPAQAMAQKLFEPTIWYAIAPNGEISVNITKAEMGQHVGTALARSLQKSWRLIELMHINHVDTEDKYGLFVTGGSWSVWQNFDLLSRAGAAGLHL